MVADNRDRDADRKAFLSDGHGYGDGLPIRRHAAQDRVNAKVDRTNSADDREKLTVDEADLEVETPEAQSD